MASRSSTRNDERAQQAAYLRGQHKMAQDAISRVLGVSQSQVSRLLRRAEERGWLYTESRFVETGIPADVLTRIKQVLAPRDLIPTLQDLARTSGVPAPNVRIFDSPTRSTTAEALQLRRERLGRSAAGRLDELLSNARIVGVGWGRMMSALIEGSSRFGPTRRERDFVRFLPLCAELIDQVDPEYSSSWLAEKLNQVVNGGSGERYSLSGVPAYVPTHYGAGKARAIWEYVSDTASHRRIFSGREPLISRMDAVLTSVGSSENPVGGALQELSKAGSVKLDTIRSLVVGDIGGILIPKAGVAARGRRRVDALNAMWTGIRLEHLRDVVQRAVNANDRGGSIVVALGAERALVVHEIIRLGLVNELIIDEDLAQALETLCRDDT